MLHNIRSTYNVGAILRTAEGFGVSRVICSGYTPWFKKSGLLPHLSLKLQRQIHKSALGAEEMLEVEWTDDIVLRLRELKGLSYQIAGLENNLEHPTVLLSDPKLSEKIRGKVVLVLGEEVGGIPEEVRKEMDLFLEIPMKGRKESFNVSVATGVALFRLQYLRV